MVWAALLGRELLEASIRADIEQAQKLWIEYKLPIPPTSARLFVSPNTYLSDDNYFHGYLDGKDFKTGVVYAGAQTAVGAFKDCALLPWDFKEVNLEKRILRSTNLITGIIDSTPDHISKFSESVVTSVAVQSIFLHHDLLAESIVRNQLNKIWDAPYDSDFQARVGEPVDRSLVASTAYLIYLHLLNQLSQPSCDRKSIYNQLVSLEQKHLIFESQKDDKPWPNKGILERISELGRAIKETGN